jgi:hypothetical protein
MGIQQTNCMVKRNSTDVLNQYVWISNQYMNTENEKHDDDDNEDDGNDDNDAPSKKF